MLLLMTAISGFLAVICPVYAYALYRKFEAFLSECVHAVKAVALQQQDSKIASFTDRTRNLPAPVKRFFERCLRDKRQFRLWNARTVGELRFGKHSKWKHLDAATVAAVNEPAFSYIGTLQMGPGSLLWARGREGYLAGKGDMVWKLWGAMKLTHQSGPHLDQSALVRYLAEAVCFPPALLPSSHLKWLPSPTAPDSCACAVINCGGAAAAATFTFDHLGRVRELRSNDFYRAQPGGRIQRTPWFARTAGFMRFG